MNNYTITSQGNPPSQASLREIILKAQDVSLDALVGLNEITAMLMGRNAEVSPPQSPDPDSGMIMMAVSLLERCTAINERIQRIYEVVK